MSIARIGTVAGRHQLPVDQYLLAEVTPGQAAYDAAYTVALALFAELDLAEDLDEVQIYYTGLTEVTLGVVDAWMDAQLGFYPPRFTVKWMRYDSAEAAYVPLRRGPRPPTQEEVETRKRAAQAALGEIYRE